MGLDLEQRGAIRHPIPPFADVGPVRVPVRLVRNPRTQRYILRVCADGAARVTIPRGGSVAAAKAFLARKSAWIRCELMHLREMNHSGRFWREVESVCPHYRIAERWLKAHARLLHSPDPSDLECRP